MQWSVRFRMVTQKIFPFLNICRKFLQIVISEREQVALKVVTDPIATPVVK